MRLWEMSQTLIPHTSTPGGPRSSRTTIAGVSNRSLTFRRHGQSGCPPQTRTAIHGFKGRRPTVGRRGIKHGCEKGTRTPTNGFRDRCSTVELSRITMGGPKGIEPLFPEPQSSVLAVRRRSPYAHSRGRIHEIHPPGKTRPPSPALREQWASAHHANILASGQDEGRQRSRGPGHSPETNWSSQPDLNRHHNVPNVVLCQIELWPEIIKWDGHESNVHCQQRRRVYSAVGSPMPSRP